MLTRPLDVPPELIAGIYAALGDRARMYDWLERGVSTRSAVAPSDGVFFLFQSYVREPRFHSLLRRMGLPDGT